MGVCAAVAMASAACAADGGWQLKLSPYLWAAGMEGDIGVGRVNVPVDAEFNDIVENLDLGFMLAAELRKDQWGLLFDGLYVKLGSDALTRVGEITADMDQWLLRGALSYRVVQAENTAVEVGAGARYISLTTEIGTPLGESEESSGWVDPIVLARVRQQFGKKFFGALEGDIGGFGASSDLTWQITAALGWSCTEHIDLLVGYRYLDYDYDSDDFAYDVAMSGVALGMSYKF